MRAAAVAAAAQWQWWGSEALGLGPGTPSPRMLWDDYSVRWGTFQDGLAVEGSQFFCSVSPNPVSHFTFFLLFPTATVSPQITGSRVPRCQQGPLKARFVYSTWPLGEVGGEWPYLMKLPITVSPVHPPHSHPSHTHTHTSSLSCIPLSVIGTLAYKCTHILDSYTHIVFPFPPYSVSHPDTYCLSNIPTCLTSPFLCHAFYYCYRHMFFLSHTYYLSHTHTHSYTLCLPKTNTISKTIPLPLSGRHKYTLTLS